MKTPIKTIGSREAEFKEICEAYMKRFPDPAQRRFPNHFQLWVERHRPGFIKKHYGHLVTVGIAKGLKDSLADGEIDQAEYDRLLAVIAPRQGK